MNRFWAMTAVGVLGGMLGCGQHPAGRGASPGQGAPATAPARVSPSVRRPAPVNAASRPSTEPASQPAWVNLFDGQDMDRWLVAQGSARLLEGVLHLNGIRRDVTILAKGVNFRDGLVEVTVLRPGGQDPNGPFTVGLRLAMRVDWTSLYFVCRSESVEVCRGSSLVNFPPPEARQAMLRPADAATPTPEVWRFHLKGPLVDCYHDGQEIISYADSEPISGSIALTASHCVIDILSVRYQPQPASGPSSRPATRGPMMLFSVERLGGK